MKLASIIMTSILFASSFAFASSPEQLERDINDLKKIVAIQQAEIVKLKQGRDKEGYVLAENGKRVIDPTGKWVGDPTGLKGDKGDQGIQGVQGNKGDQGGQGVQGLQGPQGPGAYFSGDTFVIPAQGGVLHINLQGNECLYKDDGRQRCFH